MKTFVGRLCLVAIWIGCCAAAGRLRHDSNAAHHRKLRSDRSLDATYLMQFVNVESMQRFHDTYNDRHVHVKAWYPQLQAAAVAQVSESVLWELLDDPRVAYMEADEWVYGSALSPAEEATLPNDILSPVNARNRKTATTPQQPAYTGAGVRVYVLDSGIQSDHDEFSANHNVQCLDAGVTTTTSCDDPWGHGTHVAALIGGRTYGVAPDVELIAIPVLGADSRARFSEVLAALDHIVVAEQQAHTTADGTTSRAIVNLSLGTPRVATILNAAVQRTVEAGIPVIAAAGNGATDACAWSPASAMGSIAVGALDRSGHRYKASNFGPCVDLYAPGEHITSAWKDNSLNTITGTSSASPYITGIAALYLQRDPLLTPAELLKLLLLREGNSEAGTMTVTSVPETLVMRAEDNSTVNNTIINDVLDEEVVNAARTIIEYASTTTDVPTMTPTPSSEHWFEQIRETVQLRFWNNDKGGE